MTYTTIALILIIFGLLGGKSICTSLGISILLGIFLNGMFEAIVDVLQDWRH